ncbi:MAG: hypothetical protein K0R10_448 [Alphaproteobacteria bacterium]|jgi:hypothetical protein|nr:hypothetical protein [Alphaproteobacteria bacterium]
MMNYEAGRAPLAFSEGNSLFWRDVGPHREDSRCRFIFFDWHQTSKTTETED